jgi:hypothetical protein
VVAVPRQPRAINLTDRQGLVRFVKRNTEGLDTERFDTTLGPTLVTTPEQTVLDLAHRPDLGDSEIEIPAAVAALYRRSDEDRLRTLATEQRRLASLQRAEAFAPPQVRASAQPWI